MRNALILFGVVFLLVAAFRPLDLDERLKNVIENHQLKAYSEVPQLDSSKVKLGRMLFFDKVLSGNRDVSCATCHHPTLKSGDNLQLAVGVGGYGLGENRVLGEGRDRVPRNSPEIFNRGSEEWHTMFWDGRVSRGLGTGFLSPADEKLPDGLDNVLAAQAMFPVTSRDEMRGEIGDTDIFGEPNELSLISNAAPQSVWHALMRRILSFPEYQNLFADAYPEIPLDQLEFLHAANAIAAFEIAEFTFVDSPWDRYLGGDLNAMNDSAKRGALLFYGRAKCSECHMGNLFTDQHFHNMAIPQFGPGKDNAAPLDAGRFAETGDPKDRFAFRTPPLRNVAITGPWMHNGAFGHLEDAIRHHLDPKSSLENYNVGQLSPELRETYKGDISVIERILDNLDTVVKTPLDLNKKDVDDLLIFMKALTDSSATHLDRLVPRQVPSRLPIEEIRADSAYYRY